MKTRDFIGLKFREAEKKFGSKNLELALEQFELNTCDKCTMIDLSSDLVWITEDFKPRKNEKPDKKFYEYWSDSALCEKCYLEEIKKR